MPAQHSAASELAEFDIAINSDHWPADLAWLKASEPAEFHIAIN